MTLRDSCSTEPGGAALLVTWYLVPMCPSDVFGATEEGYDDDDVDEEAEASGEGEAAAGDQTGNGGAIAVLAATGASETNALAGIRCFFSLGSESFSWPDEVIDVMDMECAGATWIDGTEESACTACDPEDAEL